MIEIITSMHKSVTLWGMGICIRKRTAKKKVGIVKVKPANDEHQLRGLLVYTRIRVGRAGLTTGLLLHTLRSVFFNIILQGPKTSKS